MNPKVKPITADFHLHSSYSGDASDTIECMVTAGIQKGLTQMCFTEHMDFDYPYETPDSKEIFLVDTDPYLYDLIRAKEKYKDQIEVLFGIEMGLQPHISRKIAAYVNSYDFDFVIGSVHVSKGMDPYAFSYYDGRTEEEAYRDYFTSILEGISSYGGFDVLGHLDYVVRYGPTKDLNYSYEFYSDIIDAILTRLVSRGKGLEINTGGIRKGLKDLHPCRSILKRFKELGGEIVTIGSDAHCTVDLAASFSLAAEALTECGFDYYTVFRKRNPEFIKIR